MVGLVWSECVGPTGGRAALEHQTTGLAYTELACTGLELGAPTCGENGDSSSFGLPAPL